MSAEFVLSFFPSTVALVMQHRPSLWEDIFPDEAQDVCSAPVYEFHITRNGLYKIPVKWPTLLPLQVLGIIIGAYGYAAFQVRGRSHRPPTPAWSLAFGFFTLMQFSALVLHCFTPRRGLWRPSLQSLDVASTACSAYAALYACLSRELDAPAAPPQGAAAAAHEAPGLPGAAAAHMLHLATATGLLNMAAFFGGNAPFLNEALYIGMTVVAAAVVGAYVLGRPAVGSQRFWSLALLASGALAFTGVPLDKHLCRWFGPHINHVTQLFLGCDLIYLCMLRYVQQELELKHDRRRAAAAAGKDQ